MNAHIKFPNNCSLQNLAKFSKELAELPKKSVLRIDTGRQRFFSPTTLIWLSQACRQRSNLYDGETLRFKGLSGHEYANNLGFSEALNIKGRPYPQGAFGGQSYIPISAMTRAWLDSFAAKNGCQLGDAIENKCNNIAQIISQDRSEALRQHIGISFREIFRNSFEHGEVDRTLFCAQYWPTRDTVEICIYDGGIGVRESLLQSKYTVPKNDKEAIYYALMPGISSKAWLHKKKKAAQRSEWDNSGYGLFFTHQLFGDSGHFLIASGESGLIIKPRSIVDLDCNVNGTLISMSLRFSDEYDIEKNIMEIQKLAHAVKQKLGVKSLDFADVKNFLENGDM